MRYRDNFFQARSKRGIATPFALTVPSVTKGLTILPLLRRRKLYGHGRALAGGSSKIGCAKAGGCINTGLGSDPAHCNYSPGFFFTSWEIFLFSSLSHSALDPSYDAVPATNPLVINSTNSLSRSPPPFRHTHTHTTHAHRLSTFFFPFSCQPDRHRGRPIPSLHLNRQPLYRVLCSYALKKRFPVNARSFFLGGFHGVRVAVQSCNPLFVPVPAYLKHIVLCFAENWASRESYQTWP